MKLLSAFLLALTLALTCASYKIMQPLLMENGTSVIQAKPEVNGTKGGVPMTVLIPKNITSAQLELLNFAYEVAVHDGHKHPEYVQAIIMQETKAGNLSEWRVSGLQNKVGDRYFGIGQVKLAAAKDVMGKYPDLWRHLNTRTEEELQARLITDDRFNIRVTSKYALMMGINENPTFGITAYNQGKTGAQQLDGSTWHYTQGVKQHATQLKTVNPPKGAAPAQKAAPPARKDVESSHPAKQAAGSTSLALN
jgi:hypothetical protein